MNANGSQHFDLILASTSPRRIEMLKQVGLNFSCLAPKTDETPRMRESAQAMVQRLAFEKAFAVLSELGDPGALIRRVILAADTTVLAPNGKTILGKPVDAAQARSMLKSLQGKTHTVLTGYCLLQEAPFADRSPSSKLWSKRWIRVVKSRVTFRALSVTQIEEYSRGTEPMDKAGAYAAQGIGQAFIEKVSGSYSNVVGLPLSQVLQDLESKFGFRGFLEGRANREPA